MKLTAPADLYLVAVGDYVSKGDVVEVDDETGESLKAQGWKGAGNRRPDVSSLRDLEPEPPVERPDEFVAALPDDEPAGSENEE